MFESQVWLVTFPWCLKLDYGYIKACVCKYVYMIMYIYILQYVTICYNMLQYITMYHIMLHYIALFCLISPCLLIEFPVFFLRPKKRSPRKSGHSQRKREPVDETERPRPGGGRCAELSNSLWYFNTGWWFGCHEFCMFPEILGISHHPNWQTHSNLFQDGVAKNHQPEHNSWCT